MCLIFNYRVRSSEYNASTYLYEGNIHKVVPGGHYKIEISVEDLPLVYATTIVPNFVKIISLDTVTKVYNEYNNFPFTHIALTFTDPAAENNTYELYSYKILKHHQNSYYYLGYQIITLGPNGIFENLPRMSFWPAYFSDKLFNGKTMALNLQEGSYNRGFSINSMDDSLICFNLANVSVDKSKYFESIDRWEHNQNNAFAEPVPIYSNIVNGVGLFAAEAVSSDTIRLFK